MTDAEMDLEERVGMILDRARPPSEADAVRQAKAVLASESWAAWQRWVVEQQNARTSPLLARPATKEVR